MVLSWFNQLLFQFECPSSQCGKVTPEVLSNLHRMKRYSCPACGVSVDLEIDPYARTISELRRTAAELDIKAVQRGEVIEWIK